MTHKIYVDFPGRIVIVGFGTIGQGILPLILRHIGVDKDRILIVTADEAGLDAARDIGVSYIKKPLTHDNFADVLSPLLQRDDFLLNVSVEVSSNALVEFCQERGALYLDTSTEPWPGGFTNPDIPAAERTNYLQRENALALRRRGSNAPTALIMHGANPGLVSHFAKQGLLDIAADQGLEISEPKSREEWALLARRLGVKVMHIAERDTQMTNLPKRPNEFVNTWSIDGFVSELMQPAELGWGTHEKSFPHDGKRHDFGCRSAIYLTHPGAATRVRSWTPSGGNFHGFLLPHIESVAIADYFTAHEAGRVVYRPTVHYAYYPSDSAVASLLELEGRNWQLQDARRILFDEIVGGVDELGVLLAGHKRNAYWYGSQLSIEEARQLVPYNNATTLQVTAAALSGMVWAIENPCAGVVEPDDIDFRRTLEVSAPYLGTLTGAYTEWTPLTGRGRLFPEDLDRTDPWQFKNVRV